MRRFDVAIVGTGHGGAQAAIQLRQLGFVGSIGLIGAEAEPPYERPPLSKDYLTGEKAFERMLIRPEAFWRERDVSLVPGARVVEVDAAARRLVTQGGETFVYGVLAWAAGGTPRRLRCPGAELAGTHVVRSKADVDAILRALPAAKRVAVIGGGYIGLEAAAALRKLGKPVVLVEALDRVLARLAGEPLSRFLAAEHRARGVDIRLGASVEALEGERSVEAVRLVGGERIAADLVLVGIGIDPAAAPLLAAGAAGSDGIDVDAWCRTSLPDVYAVGDCAAHESRWAGGRRVRIESVQNATDMATAAARAIAGAPEPYAAMPWFWSNQYDLRLQSVGLPHGHDATLVRGDPAARAFSLLYLRAGRIVALDAVNATRDYVQVRKLIESGAVLDPARLTDPAVPLKALAG
ncbi:MAG: NAD(P)/FAD-dependent oxidoreductase [Allosphingosinicella sp.]